MFEYKGKVLDCDRKWLESKSIRYDLEGCVYLLNYTGVIATWVEIDPTTLCVYFGKFVNGKKLFTGDICKRLLNKDGRYKLSKDLFDLWLIEWLDIGVFTTSFIKGGDINNVFNKKYIERNHYSQRFDELDEIIGNEFDHVSV